MRKHVFVDQNTQHNNSVINLKCFFFVGVHEQLFEDQPDVPSRSKAVDRYELLSFKSGP